MPASNALDDFQRIALCTGLDAAAAQQVFALAQPVSFMAGSRLVKQGEQARGAYILREGKVEARVTLPAGGEQVVATIEAGSMFGEMALIDRGMCSANVFAITNVDGWFIEREAFRALAAGRNAAALTIQRTITASLAQRLGALNARLRAQPVPEDRPARTDRPTTDPLANIRRSGKASFDQRRFLHLLPFFADFMPDEIDEVASQTKVIELPRGHWLFAAGQPAPACFLVVRGAVEVTAQLDGHERRLALLGPGSLVGYLSVLSGSTHGADARAREAVVLLEFPRDTLLALYNGTSAVAVRTQHAIHRNLLQSLARSNSQLSRLVTQARLRGAAAATPAITAI